MNSVKFENNSQAIKSGIGEGLENLLEEAGALIESAAAQLTRVDTGRTKGSWGHIVDAGNLECKIGNTDENSIWEEYGTGEYALAGNGRKGGWKYKDASGKWHYTKGKKPQRMLSTAFTQNKAKVISRAESIMKGSV